VIQVLVMGEDTDLRDRMIGFLSGSGMAACSLADGVALDATLARSPVNIVVMDIDGQGANGPALAARLRGSVGVGLIALSNRDDVDHRVSWLASGADSYFVKPVDMRVLEAAIRNLAERIAQARGRVSGIAESGWTFDPTTWRLTAPNGIAVELSASEQRVLCAISANGGLPVTREAILAALGKSRLDNEEHSLNAMLTRLRRKVEAHAGMEFPIRSIRAIGYAFAARLNIADRELA
jgi:DNA-binding response OmpR family regulator